MRRESSALLFGRSQRLESATRTAGEEKCRTPQFEAKFGCKAHEARCTLVGFSRQPCFGHRFPRHI